MVFPLVSTPRVPDCDASLQRLHSGPNLLFTHYSASDPRVSVHSIPPYTVILEPFNMTAVEQCSLHTLQYSLHQEYISAHNNSVYTSPSHDPPLIIHLLDFACPHGRQTVQRYMPPYSGTTYLYNHNDKVLTTLWRLTERGWNLDLRSSSFSIRVVWSPESWR